MAATCAWSAAPLVVTTRDGSTYRIHQEAQDYLTSLQSPTVHVLGVAGPPHSGKRLLLRTLLHYDAPITEAMEDERVLLWLWRPTQQSAGEAARLVIAMDTREDDAPQRKRHAMVLLLLLSSALFYNDDGEIDGAALERLSWMRDISSTLRITLNQDDDRVAAEFHNHAPKFVWVQRNSKIKWLTSSETGEKISATDYLEQCLEEETGFSDAAMRRNEQRMYFNSLFKVRDCIALSRASEGSDPVTTRDQLRPQFVEAVDKIFAAYLSMRGSHLPSKSLLGRDLRADQLVHVVSTYLQAMNANALPTIQLASNELARRTLMSGLDSARVEYSQSISSVHADNVRDVKLAHLRGLQRATIGLRRLRYDLPDLTKKGEYATSLVSLETELVDQLQSVVSEATDISSERAKGLINDLLPQTLQQIAVELERRPRDAFSDGLVALLSQHKSDLASAVDAYETQVASPAKYSALVDVLLSSVFESVKTYGASILRQYQHHMRELHDEAALIGHELDAATNQHSSTAFSADDQKRLYDEQIEHSTQQLAELRRVLLADLHDKKHELERLLATMATLDAKHEVRIKSMEDDLAWTRERTREVERAAAASRAKLDEDVSGVTDEILAKERALHQQERSLVAQHKEVMARVVELERDLVQRKTKHVQRVFVVETAIAKQRDDLQHEQAEFARQLKAQAKTDTGVLKLAYHKKKAVVQTELDRVARDASEYHAKLAAVEAVTSPKLKSQPAFEEATAKATEKSTASVVQSLRTSSREFLFKAVDSPRNATANVNATRSDTDMCKTQ